MPDYHHKVKFLTTPNGGFTKWCSSIHNGGMEIQRIRKENLPRLIAQRFQGNQSALARAAGLRQSYISDLLNKPDKSFGERAARKIEAAAGVLRGQLDIPNSPFHLDPNRKQNIDEMIQGVLDHLSPDEKLVALQRLQAIIEGRKRRRRGVA